MTAADMSATMGDMEIRGGKEQEVYGRMCHPEWGTLAKFGFSRLGGDEDSELWGLIDDGETRVMIVARRAMRYMHDPITAVIVHNGEYVNTAYNSQGLYDVLRYNLKLEKVEVEA